MRAILLVALLLGACANGNAGEELPVPHLPQRAGVDPVIAARAAGVEFRAVAEGIIIDILRTDSIRVSRTDGSEDLVFPKPEPQYPRWSGSIYETSNGGHTLRIEIRRYLACETGDREHFPTSVVIVLDGREIQACGRGL